MAKRIANGQVAFFKFELERGNAKRIKNALQELCALYRRGFILSSDQANDLETHINGILLRDGQDLKVVRWCLNALAQFGRLGSCRQYIDAALIKYQQEPEIQAGGVAALCKMYRGNVADIEALQRIDPTVWKLAALQNTDPAKLEIQNVNIDIYKAPPAILRLALITVGLNKDIEHLFHPRHTNAAFVKHLCTHDDSIVQQYSVWSVIENRRLTFDDLGIAIDDIDSIASNVQAKMYELIASRDADLRRRLDMTLHGSVHGSSEAREGLAKGVRQHYYDGLEEVTIGWLRTEHDKQVRQLLAEHIARFAHVCGPYEDTALEIIESDPTLKDRLLLGSEGRPLYGKIKGTGERDLFSGYGLYGDPTNQAHDELRAESSSSKLKVLLLTAAPLNEDRVRVDQEYREIRERLDQIRSPKVEVIIDYKPAVRSSDILPCLLNSDATIFHFSGHAWADGLIFENALGESKEVDSGAIVEILAKMKATLECVVLNGCFTEKMANDLAATVPFAISCNDTIDDDSAIIFARTFYQSLSTGRGFRDSFDLAIADLKIHAPKGDAVKYVFKGN